MDHAAAPAWRAPAAGQAWFHVAHRHRRDLEIQGSRVSRGQHRQQRTYAEGSQPLGGTRFGVAVRTRSTRSNSFNSSSRLTGTENWTSVLTIGTTGSIETTETRIEYLK